MDVTDNGDYVEAGMNMTPEDELKQRVFYASVRETIVRTSLFYKTEAFCLLLVLIFPPRYLYCLWWCSTCCPIGWWPSTRDTEPEKNAMLVWKMQASFKLKLIWCLSLYFNIWVSALPKAEQLLHCYVVGHGLTTRDSCS